MSVSSLASSHVEICGKMSSGSAARTRSAFFVVAVILLVRNRISARWNQARASLVEKGGSCTVMAATGCWLVPAAASVSCPGIVAVASLAATLYECASEEDKLCEGVPVSCCPRG